MTSFFGRVHSGLTEGLILGTLLFGLMAFGAVDPWAIIIIHWATLALIGLTAIRWLYQRDVRFPSGWLNVPISLLVLAVLLSTAGSIYRYGSVGEAARIISYIAFFYVVFMNLTTRQAVTRILMTVVIVAALLPFAGAVQDWTLAARDTSIVSMLPDSFRFATYPNENHFGAFLALVLPAGLGLAGYLFLHRQWPRFGIILVCLVVISVSLMETLTRAAWMGVVVGLLAMTAVLLFARALPGERKAWVVVATFVGLLLVLGLAPAKAVEQLKSIVDLGDKPGSMAFRTAAWKDSLPIVKAHAALGTGPGTFSLIFTRYRGTVARLPLFFVTYLHNDYLQYAVEMGVFAALGLIGFIVFLTYQLSRYGVSHSDRPEFPVVLGILGSIVAFAVAALYSFEFYITVNGLLFWATAAVGVRLTALVSGATSDTAASTKLPGPGAAGAGAFDG